MTGLSISEQRLPRLRPSDIRMIADHLTDRSFVVDLLLTFRRLMSRLEAPFAAELDDITRITLQLRMAGVWDIVTPTAFAEIVVSDVKDAVLHQFLEALGADGPREARKLDESQARSRLSGILMDATKNEAVIDAM